MTTRREACPRCGLIRQTKNADKLCADCQDVDPTWGIPQEPAPTVVPTWRPSKPMPRVYPDEAQQIIRAIVQIAQRVGVEARRPSTTCDDCGCLIRLGENCPNCALSRAAQNRREETAA